MMGAVFIQIAPTNVKAEDDWSGFYYLRRWRPTHGQETGNGNDFGTLNTTPPLEEEERHCTDWIQFYFDHDGDYSSTRHLSSIYYHIWFFSNNLINNKIGYYFYYYAGHPESELEHFVNVNFSNAQGRNEPSGYALLAKKHSVDEGILGEKIYKMAIRLNTTGNEPSIISNPKQTSFVILNLPDNDSLNSTGIEGIGPDTDGDGLTDWDELFIYYTNPKEEDTDDDGWTDHYEVNSSLTDPNNWDTDNDDLRDFEDIQPLHSRYNEDSDWIVALGDTLTPSDEGYIMNGNINVHGTLVLDSCNITMNCTFDNQYSITVNSGGTLIIKDSIIKSGNGNYYFSIINNGNLVMENASILCANKEIMIDANAAAYIGNSTIAGTCGKGGATYGIYCKSSNILIENTTIKYKWNGVYVKSTESISPIIKNNIIEGANEGVYAVTTGADPTIMNNRFIYGGNGIRLGETFGDDPNPLIKNNDFNDFRIGIISFSSFAKASGNTLRNCSQAGLSIKRGMEFKDNIISSERYNFWSENYGIICTGCSPSINNTHISYARTGIRIMDDASPKINDCIVTLNTIGVRCRNNCYATITNTTISSSSSNAIYLSSSCTALLINTTFSTYHVETANQIIIKNYLHVKVIQSNGLPLSNADVCVKDNDAVIYASYGYEGADSRTNNDGLCNWILVTDRMYIGSNTATENNTHVSVKYGGWEEDRDVDMSSTHSEAFVYVTDSTPPEITDVTAIPSPQELHGYVNISVNVSDNVDVYAVWMNITSPVGDNTGNFSMIYDSSTDRYYKNQSYDIVGTYQFIIWTNDTGDNWNSSTGQFTMQDTMPPIIEHTPITSALINSSIVISASVTDNDDNLTVTMYYKNVGDEYFNSVLMEKENGEVYSGTIPPQFMTGMVFYYIEASDVVNTATHPATNAAAQPHEITISQQSDDAFNWMLVYGMIAAVVIILAILGIILWYRRK
jgi:hypothetical protein